MIRSAMVCTLVVVGCGDEPRQNPAGKDIEDSAVVAADAGDLAFRDAWQRPSDLNPSDGGARDMQAADATLAAADMSVPAARYNFVVIMADDLGAAELGAYGNALNKTPHLDRLARQGMRFRTAWATPICSPSRVEILSGQYAHRTGWFNLIGQDYSPKRSSPYFDVGKLTTFADVLKKQGYATALVGKWQLSGKLPGLVYEAGFDEYLIWAWKHLDPNARAPRYWQPGMIKNGKAIATAASDYGPDMLVDYAIDFFQRNKNKPFLLYYPMLLPHLPLDPTPSLTQSGKKRSGSLRGSIEYLDHLVGRLLAALDALQLRTRTVVLFTGDNGTPGIGKGKAKEIGVRVPLIVSCPGTIPTNISSQEIADFSDVLPTLADFGGATLDPGHVVDGKSLKNTLISPGGQAPHRQWIYSYRKANQLLRTKRFLLEGNGKLYDCKTHREGTDGCVEVTASDQPKVVEARKEFKKLLNKLPGPDISGQQLISPP